MTATGKGAQAGHSQLLPRGGLAGLVPLVRGAKWDGSLDHGLLPQLTHLHPWCLLIGELTCKLVVSTLGLGQPHL